MPNSVKTVDEYIANCPADRKATLRRLRQVIVENLPDGFSEEISYGMPGYVVPHSQYPDGYHCDPKLPLPFCNFASQKSYIALYHMGIYAKPELLDWFKSKYKESVPRKIDMGKSCIRFKQVEEIPYQLIGELMRKISVEDWVHLYENTRKKGRN